MLKKYMLEKKQVHTYKCCISKTIYLPIYIITNKEILQSNIVKEAKDQTNSQDGKSLPIVVRLKGGDPFVFGRGGEEIIELVENNVEFEVIPGVTSAIGAPTSLGLPVTHRGVATSFTVVTGHEDPTKSKKQVKWDYTADTLIILMGIGNIKENTEEIMKYREPTTPACVIENGTLPSERIIFSTLEMIADETINTPAILIIGNVIEIFKNMEYLKPKQ